MLSCLHPGHSRLPELQPASLRSSYIRHSQLLSCSVGILSLSHFRGAGHVPSLSRVKRGIPTVTRVSRKLKNLRTAPPSAAQKKTEPLRTPEFRFDQCSSAFISGKVLIFRLKDANLSYDFRLS